jgi:hypothetical protein
MEKVGRWTAAVDYLKFLGFELQESEKLLLLKKEDKQRISRALSIIRAVLKEKSPSDEEAEIAKLGPVERNISVFEVDSELASNPNLGRVEELSASEQTDASLLMAAAKEEQNKNKQLYSDQFIVFKSRRDELKKQNQRKYAKTLVRVQFADHVVLQAFFSPFEHISDLFTLMDGCLRAPHGQYQFLVPPNTKITAEDQSKTFKDLQLVPSALLMFKWATDSSSNAKDCLTNELYASRKLLMPDETRVPEAINKKKNEATPMNTSSDSKSEAEADNRAAKKSKTASSKMPKWFKKPGS